MMRFKGPKEYGIEGKRTYSLREAKGDAKNDVRKRGGASPRAQGWKLEQMWEKRDQEKG